MDTQGVPPKSASLSSLARRPPLNNSKWETIHFIDYTYGVTNSVEFQTMTVHFERFRGGGCGYLNCPIREDFRHSEWSTPSGLQLPGKQLEPRVEKKYEVAFLELLDSP